ncbi:MAG: efflux RND transporter periplasmic adaptor subunit [candidate division Zixibacteria bacterium]|nr:efflux RND transporter periplasmic adaptor subunit [candidate division Zixibacteria bacterium]
MTRTVRRWLALSGLLIVLLIATRILWGVVVPPAISTLRVARQPITQTIVATGRVRADARVQVSSQIAGVVLAVPVREGDAIETGQLMIELEPHELQAVAAQSHAAVAQAKASVLQLWQVRRPVAQATLRQAESVLKKEESEYRRASTLYEVGSTSVETYEAARQALEAARAQRDIAHAQAVGLDSAGADIRIAEAALMAARAAEQSALARLAYTRIQAPGTGVVLTRTIEPGDAVQPGRILMELALEANVTLSVVADEKNLSRLTVGQRAVVSADAFPLQRFDAQVSYLSPVVDPTQGAIEIRLVVPDPPAYLRPDMTVSVEIEIARRDSALAVPLEAIYEPNSAAPWAYTLRDGVVVRQPLKLGAIGANFAEVTEGLSEGEAVIPVSNRTVTEGSQARSGN